MAPKRLIEKILLVGLVIWPCWVTAQDAAQTARAYHQKQSSPIVSDFRALLSLPNVATNHADMQANAEFIQAYIGKRGFTSKVVSAGGAPYVIAERPGAEGAPTVLI